MTTHPIADTGKDFISRIIDEIKVLQKDVCNLQTTTGELRSEIGVERKAREANVGSLHARLSQERSAETLLRSELEKKVDEFDSKMKTLVEPLIEDDKTIKAKLMQFSTNVEERAAKKLATDEKRFETLEAAVPLKSSIADLQNLADGVFALKGELERDRATAAAAVRTASAAAMHDFKGAQERLDKLQNLVDANKQALASDMGNIFGRVDGIESFMKTRARADDVAALDPRISQLERSLDAVVTDMRTKALIVTVNGISERVTNLTMDVQTYRTRAQADLEPVAAQVGDVERSLAKTDRQLESDRERAIAVAVALEKEISTKVAKKEMEEVVPRISAVEKAVGPLVPMISAKADKDDMPPLTARISALERGFPTKANITDIPPISLQISDHVGKHELLQRRVLQQEARIEQLNGQVQPIPSKVEGLKSQIVGVEALVVTKAEKEAVHTKDFVDDSFRDFYRREEIDAMLSRVWWRVGDMSKTRIGTPLSARG